MENFLMKNLNQKRKIINQYTKFTRQLQAILGMAVITFFFFCQRSVINNRNYYRRPKGKAKNQQRCDMILNKI